jgi:ectoine hydroxylase-related dioxygenase (phytanoyl-CoA dioxygenase family)
MGKVLEQEKISAFERDGVIFPFEAVSVEEAGALRKKAEALSDETGKIPARLNEQPHLLFPWLNDLVRHPRILDAVEDILGPNLLCWYSGFFMKQPGDGSFVSWHQDATYWGLSHPDVVTAWLALTPSTLANGCLRVVPGSHRHQILPHQDRPDENNMLSRGQEIAVEVNEADVVDVELQPGQFSIHHVQLIHGSKPNNSDIPRIGFTIRYIPTYVKQTNVAVDSASLVRGVDRYGHFRPEPVPMQDYDPEGTRFVEEMLQYWG